MEDPPHDEPDDFVIATGETHSVRQLAELAFKEAGFNIRWEGTGVDEKGIDAETGQTLVEVDPRYFRPTEVDLLLGDATKAKEKLGWEPRTSFKQLVREMVQEDLRLFKKDQLCKEAGYEINNSFEEFYV